MAERTLHATLKKRLINNEAFAYAHLIKYERPYPPLKNGKHSTDAKRYAYLTDAAINIDYNDGSKATDGSANDSQTYIADKIYKIGSYSETTEAKATGMTLELGAESLNNSFTFVTPAMTATQVDLSTTAGSQAVDVVKEGFREGDKILLSTDGDNNGKEVRITAIKSTGSFTNNFMTIATIDDAVVVDSDETVTFKVVSDELKGPLAEMDNNTLKSYHNRDVFIYKAFLDPSNLTVIGQPILIFKGIITSATIEDKPDKSLRVKWNLTSHWGDFVQVNGRITDDSVHRALDNTGKPQPAVAKKEIYASDMGFSHSEETINVLATYKIMETRTKLVKKKKWFGLSKKYKMVEYQEEVERDVDLNFSLSAKYIPVVYGVDRLQGVPVFVDTKVGDADNVYIVYSLCEGEIGGIYDLYIEGSPLICQNKEDADDRTSGDAEVFCRGRADLGDTLGGVKMSGQGVSGSSNVLADEIDSYVGFGKHGFRDIYDNIRRWNAYSHSVNKTLLNTNANEDGKGVIDRETIKITKPNTMLYTVHTGATDQAADDTLCAIAKSPGFKRQADYYDGDIEDYWGPNHLLSDTAYVVLDCEIDKDATTVPEVEYVVRGKYINCYNYDYSYMHNPVSTYSGEIDNLARFAVGDTVDIKKTSDNSAINSDVFIIDKWTIIGEGGTSQTRFRFSDAPDLDYSDGIPDITDFYMEVVKDSTTYQWHMVTTRNIEESGTVPSKLSVEATAVTAPAEDPMVITVPNDTPWIGLFPFWKEIEDYLSIAFMENGRSYTDYPLPFKVSGGNNQTLTMTGGVGAGAVTGAQEIISKNSIKLATSAVGGSGTGTTNDNFYNGMKIEMTIVDENDDYSVHSRLIDDYDGEEQIAQIDSVWDDGFEPKANDNWTYTYKIVAPRDKRVSINPAIQLLDYATSDTYGKGLINDLDDTTRSDISLSDWLHAARTCDSRGTQTLTLNPGQAATAGDRFVLTSNGQTTGSIIAMGRLRYTITSSSTSAVMEECFGKFSKTFMKNNHVYEVGDIVATTEGYFRCTTSNKYAAAPTVAAHTGWADAVTEVPIFKLTQSSGATDISSTELNLKNYDNPLYFDYTTYSLYNSDFVRYWRYLGWEDHHQRWVTRHQTCGVVDTSNSTFDNINGFLKQFNGMLSFEAGKYALRIAVTSDGAETAFNMKGEWTANTVYAANDQVYYGVNLYTVTAVTGNATSSGTAPTHTTGSASNNNITLTFVNANSHSTYTYSAGSQTNIRHINEQDIIGSVKVKDAGPKKSYNTVNSTISDPGNMWQGKQVSFYDSNFLRADKNVVKQGTFTQPSVTSYFNARINVENMLRKSRFNMTISFKLGPKALLLLTGQTIGITYDKFGWNGKKFRVTNINFNTDCTASVTAEEYDDSFYTILPLSLPSVVNDDFRITTLGAPGQPQSLTAVATAGGDITLTWTNATGMTAANETEIWVNSSSSQYGTILATVAGNVLTYAHVVGADNTAKHYWIRHKVTRPIHGIQKVFHGAYFPTSGSVTATTSLPSLNFGLDFTSDSPGGFKANSAGVIYSPDDITFTLERTNLSATASFASNNTGTNVTLTGSGDTRVLTRQNMGSVASTVITATVAATQAEEDSGASSSDYTKSLTISKTLDGPTGPSGTSSYSVIGTNENHTFIADVSGAVSMTGFTCDFTVKYGTQAYTYDGAASYDANSFRYGTITAVGVTQAVNASNGQITLDGSSAIATDLDDIAGSLTVPIIDNADDSVIATRIIIFSKSVKASRDGGVFIFDRATAAEISATNAVEFAQTNITTAAARAAAEAVFDVSSDTFIRPNDRVTVTDVDADKAGTRIYTGSGVASSSSIATSDWSSLVVEVFDGSVIVDGTLSADKLTANTTTTNTLNVGSNMVLATGGKFYTPNKTAFADDSLGIYMDTGGDFNIGDGTNYLKFDASEGQFSAAGTMSVTGPAGPTGPTGGVGPSGSVGPTGGTGPTGPTGVAGADGDDGSDGAAGAAGRTVGLTAATQAFTYLADGSTPSPGTSVLTATATNTTGTVYYDFVKNDSSVQNSTTATYTYGAQAAHGNMPDKMEVQIREGGTGGTVKARDQLDMIGIKPGTAGDDAHTGFLTNQAHVVAAAAAGTGYSLTGAGGTFKMYDGSSDVTGASTTYYAQTSGTNVTETKNGLTMTITQSSGVYALSGGSWTSDKEDFTLRGTHGGVTVTLVYSISKSKVGGAGTDGAHGAAYYSIISQDTTVDSGEITDTKIQNATGRSFTPAYVQGDTCTVVPASGGGAPASYNRTSSAWAAATLSIDGSLVATGTIAGGAIQSATTITVGSASQVLIDGTNNRILITDS